MENNQIVNVEFQEIIDDNQKIYSISQIATTLKTSTTIINSIIFKLNKRQKGFIKDTNKVTQKEFETIELAFSLYDNGKSLDEIAEYFINNKNGLINKEDLTIKKDLTKMDSQVIAKNITLEVKRQTDRILEELKGNFSDEIFKQFESQASKIAKVSLAAMEETKNVLCDELKDTKEEIIKLREENEKARLENLSLRSENEELATKEINRLKRKLNMQEEELKKKENELKLKEIELEKVNEKKGIWGFFKR